MPTQSDSPAEPNLPTVEDRLRNLGELTPTQQALADLMDKAREANAVAEKENSSVTVHIVEDFAPDAERNTFIDWFMDAAPYVFVGMAIGALLMFLLLVVIR